MLQHSEEAHINEDQPGTTPMSPGDEVPPGTAGAGDNLCPVCHGTGKRGSEACSNCGGTGVVTEAVGGA